MRSKTPNASHPRKRPLWPDRPGHHAGRLTKPFRSPLAGRPSSGVSDHHHTDATEQLKASHRSAKFDTSASLTSPAAISIDDIDSGTDANTLYKQYRSVSLELTQLRQSLDTAQQAMAILRSDQTAAVERLIEKWKGIVRDATEELYLHAKERIDRDPSLVTRRRRSFGAFEESKPVLSKEQRESLQAQQDEERAQAVKYGLIQSVEDVDEDFEEKDQSFTIATMLRQMDVDMNLVGYDQKEDRWVADVE